MAKKDNLKNKMHPTDKKILVGGAIACVLVVGVGIGLRVYLSNREPLPVAPQSVPPVSSQSVDMSKYDVPKKEDVKLPSKSETDHITETTDENGDYLKEQTMGKPDAPSEPPKLADGADVTDPSKPPEYDQGSTTNKDPKPGEKNANGDTYIPGIGWVGENDKGSGGMGETIEMGELSGNQIGH